MGTAAPAFYSPSCPDAGTAVSWRWGHTDAFVHRTVAECLRRASDASGRSVLAWFCGAPYREWPSTAYGWEHGNGMDHEQG